MNRNSYGCSSTSMQLRLHITSKVCAICMTVETQVRGLRAYGVPSEDFMEAY